MKNVSYRRKREGRTNYNKRLQMLVSRKLRIVVRKSLRAIQIQVVDYDANGDKILIGTHSRELKALGMKKENSNIPTAYLTGLLCGKKAVAAGLTEGIIDLGLQRAHSGGKLFAVIQGLLDAGFKVPYQASALPGEDRLGGKHTADADTYTSIKEKILTK
jgi:large subunit ribosomal protein L18